MAALTAWENFYIIIGSSAGALIGLTFVAVTLIAETRSQGAGRGIPAFTTPTVVQFGVVLFICATLSAPWTALFPPALILGLSGLAGVFYTVLVVRRQRRLDTYTPVVEDWLSYTAGPLLGYIALAIAAVFLPSNPTPTLFAIGGTMSLLLFIAIHNAWDVVTYIAIERFSTQSDSRVERRDGGEEQKES